MKSKYDTSTCSNCNEKIKKGEDIEKTNELWVHCTCPTSKAVSSTKTETPGKIIKPKDPFEETELIIQWASDKAFKKSREGLTDMSKLTTQQINGLGQKEGMLTRLYSDLVIKLMEINNIKSAYEVKK